MNRPDIKNRKKGIKFKNFVFFAIWFYVLLRMVGIDLDLSIARRMGLRNMEDYLVLRLLIVLLILFVIWHKLKFKRFFKNVGLLFLFPIYPLAVTLIPFFIWYFPAFLIRKNLHFFFFTYVELILNFFAELKGHLIKIVCFLIGLYIMFQSNGSWLVIPVFVFSILLLGHLYKRYRQTFAPVTIFRLNFTTSFDKTNPFSIEKVEKDFELQNANTQFTKNQIVFKQIEHIIIMSTFGDMLVEKVKEILTNRTYLKSLLWKILYSFLLAMFLLGGINFSIYKLNHSNFKVDFLPNFFNFFYYSFFTVIPDGTDIEPVTELAKLVRMAGVSIGIILNVLILSFYFLVFTDKYKENLYNLIEYFEKYSQDANAYITDKFKTPSSQTIEKLRNESDKIKSIKRGFDALFGKRK